jgi:hypothetical protein
VSKDLTRLLMETCFYVVMCLNLKHVVTFSDIEIYSGNIYDSYRITITTCHNYILGIIKMILIVIDTVFICDYL